MAPPLVVLADADAKGDSISRVVCAVTENALSTVLVVDDDTETRTLIQAGLENEGYRVLTAPDGQSALDVLNDASVNLILLDMHMPVMDGWTFVRNYHRQQPPWVPVVVVTAAQDATQRAANVGADDHVGKPFELDELLLTVKRNLEVGDGTAVDGQHLRIHSGQDVDDARARLVAIVDSSSDAIIGKTLDGTITTWNSAAERLYGYAAAEVIGHPIALLVPADRDDETPALLERIRRGERITQYETERVHKTGRRLIVSLSLSPIENADGSIVGAAAIAHDITARRQRDATLQRYRLLVGNTRDIVLFIGLDGRILECNAAAVAAYGYERTELLDLSLSDLRAPAQRAIVPEQMRQAAKAGMIFETIHLRKDGTSFPIEVSWVTEDIGETRILLSIARDITERRAAQADLRVQSAALEAAANSIIITDRHGAIQWANVAFSQLTGYSLEEARGQNLRLLKSGQQDAAFYANLWKTILDGQVWRGQLVNRHKTGQTYTIEMTITPVRDEANQISHFIAINEDITQRLQAELLIQTAAAEMATAQQIAHLGSWEMDLTFLDDLDRNPLHWSAESFRIFGYTPGEVVVTNALMFERIHPEDRAVVRAALERTIGEGAPYGLEHRIVLRDGAERIVFQRDDVVYDASGQPCRLVGSVQDITERKRIELELAKLLVATQVARGEAESAVRTRDEFLTIAAHELKTPVTAIKLAAQLLNHRTRMVVDPPHAARLIQTLDTGASRLARLIEDLLDVARLQTGQLQVRAQEVDLSQLVVETIAAYQPQLSSGHALVAEGNASPCLVSGDADRLQQVLSNLIDNSVKYSPRGGSIGVSVQAAQDGYVVQVTDQGIGVPAGSEELIFQPFGRASNATRSAIQGMGLGLYICQQIVVSHGGRIWAATGVEEQGAVMNVWLPKAGVAKADPRGAP